MANYYKNYRDPDKHNGITINGHKMRRDLLVKDPSTSRGFRCITVSKGLWYFLQNNPEGFHIVGTEEMPFLFTLPVFVPADAISIETEGKLTFIEIEIEEIPEELELQLSIFEELKNDNVDIETAWLDFITVGEEDLRWSIKRAIESGRVYSEIIEEAKGPAWATYYNLRRNEEERRLLDYITIPPEARDEIIERHKKGQDPETIRRETGLLDEAVRYHIAAYHKLIKIDAW